MEEKERPFICVKCGWRSFNLPNVHECKENWPFSSEAWDARWAAEIKNDPRMEAWIKYVNSKHYDF